MERTRTASTNVTGGLARAGLPRGHTWHGRWLVLQGFVCVWGLLRWPRGGRVRGAGSGGRGGEARTMGAGHGAPPLGSLL